MVNFEGRWTFYTRSFLANQEWLTLYPSVKVRNFATTHPDHNYLLLNTNSKLCNVRISMKLFKFEEIWIGVEGCEDIISNSGGIQTYDNIVDNSRKAISLYGSNLQVWNCKQFGHIYQ